MAKILIASSDKNLIRELCDLLPEEHSVTIAGDSSSVEKSLEKVDLIFADPSISLPVERFKDIPIILIVEPREELISRMVDAGVWDILTRPLRRWQVELALGRAIRYLDLTSKPPREEIEEFIVGQSYRMLKVLDLANRIASSKATVLIQGETGTGKEILARYIHRISSRGDKPFIPVNCGALPDTLVEDELFGHEKGAYTDAYSERKGKFELADGGTLFLDEITTLSPSAQVKLLRVLQEEEFERIGGTKPIKVDVRIIAASNEDVKLSVQEGRFREDLFYRLNVVTIDLPPLRERREDIPLLVEHFIRKHSIRHEKKVKSISDEAMRALMSYNWPGNVRELENAIERAIILSEGETIQIEDLPAWIAGEWEGSDEIEREGIFIPFGMKIEDVERKLILETLRRVGGDKTKAARILGISRRTIYRKLQE
ncbi:TPA: sigma-54-dependent Fis family transcriptional regulator [Candidatus Poribacteria bacterium]|nr:sigma-54-dependent Fis family transcriptional regulator [Candidatus Poribacteria bacterium]